MSEEVKQNFNESESRINKLQSLSSVDQHFETSSFLEENKKQKDELDNLVTEREKKLLACLHYLSNLSKLKKNTENQQDESEYEDIEEDYATSEEDFPPFKEENSDISEECEQTRYVLAEKHSFMELCDPGLNNAFEPKKEETQKKYYGKKADKHNYIDLCNELGIKPLGIFLKKMHSEVLDLSGYGLNVEEIVAICKMLEINTSVKIFIMSGNNAGQSGGEAIAQLIEKNNHISHLDLSSTEISKSMKKIANALIVNETIEILDLSRNGLGNREMFFLAQYLRTAIYLKELYLNHNRIEDAGVEALGHSLKANSSLETFDIGWNCIRGLQNTKIFFASIANHPTLIKLNIFGNSFSDSNASGILQILTNNENLKLFDISFNRFDKAATGIIANGMSQNQGIEQFIVGPNRWRQISAANLLNPLLNVKAMSELKEIDFGLILDVHKQFLNVKEKVRKLRPNLKILHGLEYGFYNPQTQDIRTIVMRRAKIICENFETPLELLIDELCKEPKVLTAKKFRKFIKSCNLYKNAPLTRAFIKHFAKTPYEVDCAAIIAKYDELYRPKDLEPRICIEPPPPEPKVKKGKKSKGKKSKQKSKSKNKTKSIKKSSKKKSTKM